MTDWNRDGRTDAADIAAEYAAYRAIMGEDSTAHRSAPTKPSTNSTGAGAAWALIAAAVLALLIAIAR